MQSGLHAAHEIRHAIAGQDWSRPFKYRDLGSAAYISRGRAVVSAGPLQFGGFPGWVAWLFIHIAFLTGYRNRVGAILTWWVAFTRDVRRERAFTTRQIGVVRDLYAPPSGARAAGDAPGPADYRLAAVPPTDRAPAVLRTGRRPIEAGRRGRRPLVAGLIQCAEPADGDGLRYLVRRPATSDPAELGDRRARENPDGPGRRRRPDPGRRQPDPQRAGERLEDQRRLHPQRLAVDADLHQPARTDLEPRRAPLQPAREPAELAGGLQRREPACLRSITDPGRDDAEHPEVHPLPGTPPARMIQLIGVVRDQDELRRRVAGAIGATEPQVQRDRIGTEELRKQRSGCLELGIAVVG